MLDYISVIVAFIGTILNSRGDIRNFYIYAISNTMLIVYMLSIAQVLLAVYYLAMLVLNYYGIIMWSKKGDKERDN